jgi:SlyX protein
MNSNKAILDPSEGLSTLNMQVQNLEINQTFQEDHIEAMEKTIVQQQQSIQTLQNQISLLSEYLKTMRQEAGQGGVKNQEDEVPPPHY